MSTIFMILFYNGGRLTSARSARPRLASIQQSDLVASPDNALRHHRSIDSGLAGVGFRHDPNQLWARLRRVRVERDHLAARVLARNGNPTGLESAHVLPSPKPPVRTKSWPDTPASIHEGRGVGAAAFVIKRFGYDETFLRAPHLEPLHRRITRSSLRVGYPFRQRCGFHGHPDRAVSAALFRALRG